MNDDPQSRLRAMAARFRQSPFIAHMGLDDVRLEPDGAVAARMKLRPEHERGGAGKQFHGGPIAAFIDTVGDLAVALEVGGGVPTINMRVDYLKPALGDGLTARARVRRLGRTVAVADIDVFDDSGALVAIGRATYANKVG